MMYTLRNVAAGYDFSPILKIDLLEIRENSITAFTGENGVGKTTMLRLLNLLLKPIEGQIFFNDKLIDEKSIRQKTIYTHQNPFYFNGSVSENILKCCSSFEKTGFTRVVEQLNLRDKIESDISTLSGGEKKRVAIARAIICDRMVYIFDEPCSSLDGPSLDMLNSVFRELKEAGKTVIFSSHNNSFVDSTADYRVDIGRLSC